MSLFKFLLLKTTFIPEYQNLNISTDMNSFCAFRVEQYKLNIKWMM